MTAAPHPATPTRTASDPVAVFTLLLAILAILAINNRILTYVSGQDPTTYVRTAHDILRHGLTAAFPHGGGLTAPGHPLLLAAAMALFGPFAPYWINVSLTLLLMPLALFVLIRLGLSPRTSAIAVFASVLLLAAGYQMNAAFLLYPFRELPAIFFTVAGVLLFLIGCDSGDRVRRRALFCVAAGFCALLTAAIREPNILGFAGILLWCLASRTSRTNRAVALGSFAAPLILAFLAWLVLTHASSPNRQWEHWVSQFNSTGLQSFLHRFGAIERQMRSWFLEELGWFWSAMSLAGVWSMRRQPRALFALLVPAVLLYVFYGFMEAHRRYLLSVLLFVAPLAGCGLGWLIESLSSRLSTRRPVFLAAPTVAVSLSIAFALVPAVTDLQPTGPRVKAVQVEKAVLTITRAAASADFQGSPYERSSDADAKILLCPYSRYAADAISSFTSLGLVDIGTVKPARLAAGTFLVLSSLNEEARFRNRYVPYSGPDASLIAAHYADLEAAYDPSGGGASFTLGHGQYALSRMRPWSTNRFEMAIRLDPATNDAHVIWLDFRNSDPSARKTVSIVNPTDGSDAFVATITGNGLQPVLVPAGIPAGVVPLHVQSSGPIPRDVPVTIQTGKQAAGFALDDGRSLSVRAWLAHPFKATTPGDKYAGVFDDDGGRLEIPMPAASSDLRVEGALLVDSGASVVQPATFRFMHLESAVGEMRLGPGRGHWQGFRIDHVKTGQPLEVVLQSASPESKTAWRIHRAVIAIHPADTP